MVVEGRALLTFLFCLRSFPGPTPGQDSEADCEQDICSTTKTSLPCRSPLISIQCIMINTQFIVSREKNNLTVVVHRTKNSCNNISNDTRL